MTSEKSQIIVTFDSKDTAKWRPLPLANKLNGYVSEGKISNDDIFVKYIEIIPNANDDKNKDAVIPESWSPGDMCLFFFADASKINNGVTINKFMEMLNQMESACPENQAIGEIDANYTIEKSFNEINPCLIRL
jgi:hypothetical protein